MSSCDWYKVTWAPQNVTWKVLCMLFPLLPLSEFSRSRPRFFETGLRGLRIRVKVGVGADLGVFLSAICIFVSNVSVLMILRVSKLTAGLFSQISFVPLLRRQKKWSSVPWCESRDFCLHRRRFSVGIVASSARDESLEKKMVIGQEMKLDEVDSKVADDKDIDDDVPEEDQRAVGQEEKLDGDEKEEGMDAVDIECDDVPRAVGLEEKLDGDKKEEGTDAIDTECDDVPRAVGQEEKPDGDKKEEVSETRRGEWFHLTGPCSLVLHRGDITKWFKDGKTDAIVNAANEMMLGGGGVDGAIHRAAGRKLFDACFKVPEVSRGVRCPIGSAVITPGFRLPVAQVIHTVGPMYHKEEDPAGILARAYKRSVALAKKSGVKYVAFPAISCGVYGYPYEEAAKVSIQALQENAGNLEEVHFVLFEEGTYRAWLAYAEENLERLTA